MTTPNTTTAWFGWPTGYTLLKSHMNKLTDGLRAGKNKSISALKWL